MTKHTPGPWSVERRSVNDVRIMEGDTSSTIATLGNWLPEFRAERDANARLIAAAPDMVEALLDAIAVIEAHINMTGAYKRGIYGHLPSSCRAALKKARGE